MLTQEKIDAMSNNKFIEDIIKGDKSKYKISESRSIFKNSLNNGGITYSVSFDYTIIKQPTFFDKNYRTFKKTLLDHLTFKNKSDAEYFAENAFSPSYMINCDSSEIEYKLLVYVNPMKEFYQYGYDRYIIAIKYRNVDVIYNVFKNNYKISSTYTIKNLIDELKFHHNIIVKKELIQTIDINDIFNIKKTNIDKLKENIDESKDKCSSIIIAEIERTQEYLELLKKLL